MKRKCLLSSRRGWQCPAGPFGLGSCLVCIFHSGRPLGLLGMTCYGKWWITFCRGYMSWFFLNNIYNRLCIFPSNVHPPKMGRKTYALKQLVRDEKQEAQTWRGWVEGADAPFLTECTHAGTWQTREWYQRWVWRPRLSVLPEVNAWCWKGDSCTQRPSVLRGPFERHSVNRELDFSSLTVFDSLTALTN